MGREGPRGPLPTGTVTFLFSDVERSTQTVAELGDERYADLQDEHRAILREAFAAHGGVEVTTEGDACFVAFRSANQAVAAAERAQREIVRRSPLRVRIGLHTGEALVRGDDYIGHEVHRAKRISDAGHGGQVLLSKTTADMVTPTAALKDLGAHRLKDLSEPQRIYQLVADGLGSDFAPLRSLDVFHHNLPPQRTPFIGRESAMERVTELLSTWRLVTLTGVGGAGKTRLAIQVGAIAVDGFPDGVFFCDLAPVTETALVPGRVAASVGCDVREMQAAALVEDVLIETLAPKRALLILDNCEHLIDACANLADRILASCPGVRLLATSREGLDIDGEHAYAVRSLELPTGKDPASSESVRLFVDRARAVLDDFDLDDENLTAVIEICERLDGIPLALELAAAQIAHLSPEEIARRLGDRFALLTGGRKRVQRQQTLAAAVDWSYDLLTDAERKILRRLAVFPSTFALQAVEAVCAQLLDVPVLAVVRSLVAKSLLTVEGRGSTARYRLLETIRLYAQDKLVAESEADEARDGHRDFVLAAIEGDPAWRDFRVVAFHSARPTEDDVWVAHAWCERQQHFELMARLAVAATVGWMVNFEEAIRTFDVIIAHEQELPVDLRADVFSMRATLGASAVEGTGIIESYARRAIELTPHRCTLSMATAYAVTSLMKSFEAVTLGADVAEEVRDLGRRAYEAAPDANARLGVVFYYGLALVNIGATDDAIAAFEEARGYDPDRTPPMVSFCLALLYHVTDQPKLARESARQAIDDDHEFGSPGWRLYFSFPWALALAADGECDRAIEFIREKAREPAARSIPGLTSAAVVFLGGVLALRGDTERASVLLAAARAGMDRGIVRGPLEILLYAHHVARVRAVLPRDVAGQCRERGYAMSLEDAIAYGLEHATST